MKRSELKQLIKEVIQEVNGQQYWDEDKPLNKLPFNIIAGEEAILKKEWFESVINHLYYRKEDKFLRLDGTYKTFDGSGKGRFSVFVESDGTIGAETNGSVQGHFSGKLDDQLPHNPDVEKPKNTLYLSFDAKRLVKRALGK
jgi:hypothetical protein